MPTYDKEFIIRYAEDELDAAERRQFEADLERDASLRAELALYLEVKATLQQRLPPDERIGALRGTLSTLNKQYFKPKTPVRRIPLTRWLTGVAAAAVIAIGTILFWPSGNQDLIDRLGRTEMAGTTERGNNSDTLIQEAAGYFNRQEFAKALPVLDRAVKADSAGVLALFYRGLAAWHTGAVGSARKDLEQVYNGESLLRYDAAFYLALTYAAEKNNAAALGWLGKIPEGTPVSDKAKELRASLK